MNSIVPIIQPTIGLVPASMAEAIKLAEMMASAKLVPAALQKSPADCLMVIQQAVRWQMDPFAVAQECSVIQGKLMHSGKLVAAVVNARGNLAERLSFAYSGQGDARTITVSGRCQGEIEARTVTVRLGDAKTNNRVWQSQPDQQLMYHGARVWARRHTPELMLGVYSPEEFDEVNGSGRMSAAPAAPAPLELSAPANGHDPDTGEVGPREIALRENGGHVNWIEFGQALIAGVQSAAGADEADEWLALNQGSVDRMLGIAPKAHARLVQAIEKHRATLAPAMPRLSEKDSATLRMALIQKLGKAFDIEAVDRWKGNSAEGYASLVDADRKIVDEAEDMRRGSFEDEPPDSGTFEG